MPAKTEKAAAKPRKAAAKPQPELVFENGYWWVVSGSKRLNVGRSERYAHQYLAEMRGA